jgi:hypothetical protein
MAEPDPSTGRYRTVTMLAEGDHLALPGGRTILVSELFPPR